jgi:hypothetical protein
MSDSRDQWSYKCTHYLPGNLVYTEGASQFRAIQQVRQHLDLADTTRSSNWEKEHQYIQVPRHSYQND